MQNPATISDWNSPHIKARFSVLCREEICTAQNCYRGGIGTLAEKRMHRVFKRLITDDESKSEVRISATLQKTEDTSDKVPRFVADILTDGEIIEIQTGSFFPMQKKLDWCMHHTPYRLTVIHPIAARRTLAWLDPISGTVGKPRRVSRRENALVIASELYWIRPILTNPELRRRFCLVLPLLEVQDYKWLDGYSADGKRGATRYERIPISLLETIVLSEPEDYAHLFFPASLPHPFTAAEYAAATRIRGRTTYSVLHLFCEMGILRPEGKRGRSVTYTWTCEEESAPVTRHQV